MNNSETYHRNRRSHRVTERRRVFGDVEPPGQPQLADGADARDHRDDAGARGHRCRGEGGPLRWGGSRLQFRCGHQRSRPRQSRGQRHSRPTCSPRRTAPFARSWHCPSRWSPSCTGPAAGVGVSLAISADIVLASDKAYFLLAFTKIGLMPDGGASALVAAAIGRTRAMRLALLAERLPAADALAAGLVSAVYPADELDAAVDRGRRDAEVRPGGGAAQDQAGHQRRDADRARRRIRARDRGPAGPARFERLP